MATAQGWTCHSVRTGIGLIPILARDYADHVVAVPARPLLARDERGRPKLSLTLVLSKRPSVNEPSITPFVTQGTFAFTTTLALPDATTQIADAAHKPIQPLFARAAEFSLRYEGTELQRLGGFGPGATAALSVTLSREAALSVLNAVRDEYSGLSIECDVDYAVKDPPRYLHLQGSYSDIYKRLASVHRQPLDRAELEKAIEAMLYSGTLRADSEPSGLSIAAITSAFVKASRPVLQRVTAIDGERYSVRRPPQGQWLDVTLTFSNTEGRETLKLATRLDEMFRGCLDGHDTGAFIHLVAPDAVGSLEPMPRRIVQPPARAARSARGLGTASLARVGASTIALSAAARPNALAAVSAHTLLSDVTVQPTRFETAKIHHWALDNVAISAAVGNSQPAERSLPVVDDDAAPLWPDRVDAKLRWYAPQLAAESPTPNSSADASPFLFSFLRAGHTMSGAPGLEARIRFRLTSQMSDTTRAAWEATGKPNVKPVPLGSLSVALAIPFRDQAGVTRSQMFPATVTVEGTTVVAEIALLDDWVRLAYGALSTPSFQSQPAILSVAYTYEGYVPLNEDNLALLMERKQALVPVQNTQGPDTEPHLTNVLDARELVYRTALETIRFTREQDAQRTSRAGPALVARPQTNLFAIRPEIAHSTAIAELVKQRRHGIQRVGRDESRSVIYPCATLGALYIQDDTEAGPAAIGCQDAFKLGQTEYRQYLRLDELADPEFSVWRSLQQPGRFLLVPMRWSIARFAADDADRAYRPSILVYSVLDAAVPGNNRCAVLASLIPDISPVKRRALLRSLTALAEKPVVTLINEIDAQLEYTWPLPSNTGVDARVAKLFDSFQVTLATGIDFMPQLQTMLQRSGVVGIVRYRLPDGTSIESALALDLNRIVGPEPDGPLEVVRQGSRVALTNRIERAVDVSDLVVEAADDAVETVRIDRRLEPGDVHEAPLRADATRVTPVITMPPGEAATLTEIRSFVEDIHTNVAFVNLINYANHALATLSLQVRLRGVAGAQTLELQESAPVAAVDFVLPLTTYLANPVLEFAVTKSMKDGAVATTAWQAWPLVKRGNVVSLTWDLIK